MDILILNAEFTLPIMSKFPKLSNVILKNSLVKGIFKKRSFSCFDMTMNIAPAVVLSLLGLLINVGAGIYSVFTGGGTAMLLLSFGQLVLNTYLMMFVVGAITTATEWKNIYCSAPKKVLYAFTFPLFMLTYLPICIAAMFRPVKWEPIVHDRVRTLSEVRSGCTAA